MESNKLLYIKFVALGILVCVCVFLSVLFVRLDHKQVAVTPSPTVVTPTQVTQPEPVEPVVEEQIKHYSLAEDVRSLQTMDSLKAISACYDNTRSSQFYYTGIPQVDNCITILSGQMQPELIEDYDDYLGSELVHNYIVGICGSVYNIVYIPDSEAIALPLMVNVTEYLNGIPYRATDNSRGYDD